MTSFSSKYLLTITRREILQLLPHIPFYFPSCHSLCGCCSSYQQWFFFSYKLQWLVPYPGSSMEIFWAFWFQPFPYVKKLALRRWIWFSPDFCCSFVWLLIYFSLEFSVLTSISFCSLRSKVCCMSGKWDFESNFWWKFSEELSMYLQDKKWWCALSAAEAISLSCLSSSWSA